ncbi:MAG: 16S rRNA (cytosine(967)-C(5))-methyltransferase RsmB [Deltaproteobacteria bacterium]|nr:16S rRNA (cytosine(967)-C(5))-methyltransferase RsmB [Deltaproteobacteria bacterium]
MGNDLRLSSRDSEIGNQKPKTGRTHSTPIENQTARSTALKILDLLDRGHHTLDHEIERAFDQNRSFTRRDRAFIHALVYGVLRWRAHIDWIVNHFSKTRFDKIDPRVLNILRLGLFQILFLDKIPTSAAVDTSVQLTKSFAAPWVAGFVNAVLRKSATQYERIDFPDPQKQPVLALAVKKSFPEWLIHRWLNRFGSKETITLCDAINKIPPITIRTNTLRSTRAQLIQYLQHQAHEILPTSYAPEGITLVGPSVPIQELDAFVKGWFQVQDEASQMVTSLLGPHPGETVLDACAGLGGKTGHMTQLMQNRGCIVAMDRDGAKLIKLSQEMQRLGSLIVQTRIHDLNYALSPDLIDFFDRILLDAPCSGLGVLRRNPDIKWNRKEANLYAYQKNQITFLDSLTDSVKPGGVVVFAVCSMEPEETDHVVTEFLKRHSNFRMDRGAADFPPQTNPVIDEKGCLRTYPHLNNTDGFFAVSLKRTY